ncbi:MAG: hypothetical protein OXH37_11815 [Gammaproteobacteria bacterium]|nr:hypothetical protein [Gammaproteobacteria bacterium]
MTALPFPWLIGFVCAVGTMVTDNQALGVGFGYTNRLKDLWEIALLGLGTSAQLAAFDITAMAFVRRRLRVSLFF